MRILGICLVYPLSNPLFLDFLNRYRNFLIFFFLLINFGSNNGSNFLYIIYLIFIMFFYLYPSYTEPC